MELTLGRTGGPYPHKIDFSISCLGNVGHPGGLEQSGRPGLAISICAGARDIARHINARRAIAKRSKIMPIGYTD